MNDRSERPKPERRGSSLSPEEVQQAIEVRKKALKSPDVDLGTIARTAPAISSSPTQPTAIVTDADVCVSSTLRACAVSLTLSLQTNTLPGGALKQ